MKVFVNDPSVMILLQGKLSKFKVTHIFVIKKKFLHVLPTKIADDLRMCHSFDQRSVGHDQSSWKQKCKISVWSI